MGREVGMMMTYVDNVVSLFVGYEVDVAGDAGQVGVAVGEDHESVDAFVMRAQQDCLEELFRG